MSTEEIIRYVMSFLGGGVVVTVGNWIHAANVAKRERAATHLSTQLKELYGPLYYFTNQNARLFDLSRKFDAAYTDEIASKNWSQDQRTRESVQSDAEATISLSNEYVQNVVKNNDRIAGLLENSWHLIDADDIEEFSAFQIHHARLKVEVEGGLKTPFMIYQHVGTISYMPPSMIERVENKFRAKNAKLQAFRE